MPADPTNLIRIFDFYLALMFLISFLRRWGVYMDALRLLVAVRGRWPKLIQRLGEHKSIILNWSFFRPAFLALFLMLTQLVVSRLIFPSAALTGVSPNGAVGGVVNIVPKRAGDDLKVEASLLQVRNSEPQVCDPARILRRLVEM